jgi:hypothetical protein
MGPDVIRQNDRTIERFNRGTTPEYAMTTSTLDVNDPNLAYHLHKFPCLTKITISTNIALPNDIAEPSKTITHIHITNNWQQEMMNLSFIKSFPNLEHLTFAKCRRGIIVNEAIQYLRTMKHKIKKITCDRVHNMNSTELQSYCDKNGIQLEFC